MTTLIERIKQRANSDKHIDLKHLSFGSIKLHDPINEKTLRKTEVALGFNLPPLIHEAYLEIGNGGFGPGYGLIGFKGGALLDTGHSVDELYHLFRSAKSDKLWPEKLLPICHWGDAIYSCVDCSKKPYQIIRFEECAEGLPWESSFKKEASSLEQWLIKWADGEELFKIS